MCCRVAVVSNSPVFSPPLSRSSSSSSSSPSPSSRSLTSPSPFRCSIWAAAAAADPPPPPPGDSDDNGPSTSSSLSASAAAAAVLLKRKKRPARLNIPALASGFGVLATPMPEEEDEQVLEEKDGFYSVCCKRGSRRRAAFEDRFSALIDFDGDTKQAFFGVFDGHGGVKAAEFAAKNIGKNIMDEVMSRGREDVEEAVRHGYLKTDSEFLKEDSRGGSCCVTALIKDGNVVVSNAGDCRAVMSNGGLAVALTSDHRPCRNDEKERIEAMGGYVDCYHGVWRIQGSLAVSRGIGDGHLKQFVIAEPETKIHRIESTYEFLILASDGLWDKVSNQEAIDIARPLCIGSSKPEPLAACKKLIEISASRGSSDDISVMLIQLEQYRL